MPEASFAPPGATELYDLIWFPNPDWVAELATVVLPEDWGEDENERPHPILFSYFKYYTKRIVEEGLLIEASTATGTRLGAFDTGLLSKHFEPIYAVFQANQEPDRQPWVHKEWATPSSSRLRSFALDSIQRALFYSNPGEVVFDSHLPVVPNLEHIIDENVDRYPPQFQENAYQRRAALEGAIKVAAAKAKANWRLAAPQFYWPPYDAPGRVQLLLPLSLVHPDRVDLALVLDRLPQYAEHPGAAGARYQAHTVLPVEWAYRNARLITRPEASWLDIHTIEAEG
jgi:hypothetical protein